jgi:ABC-type transport system involved in Fe-S cluster assembly fused permease/ATPase subunit
MNRVREILDLIASQTTPFVRRCAIMVLLLVLTPAALAPIGPVALKLIVDGLASQAIQSVSIVAAIALYVLSQWIARVSGEVRGVFYTPAERRMSTAIMDRVFSHVMQLPLRFHLQRATGAIAQTIDTGVQGFHIILQQLLFAALPVVVQFGTTVWILRTLHQPLFVVLFVMALACYATAFFFFILRATETARAASAAHVEASGTITDALLNYETVKLFSAEGVVRKRVHQVLAETEQRWVKFTHAFARNGALVATIHAVFLAVAIAYSASEVRAGRMTIGEFVLVNTYMLQLMQPAEMLGAAVQGITQGGAMLEKMMALLREQPEVIAQSAGDSHVPAVVAPASLEFRNVSLSYQDSRLILRNLSFEVPSGHTLGIVGGSGAGKSTIVRLLVGLLQPDAGDILIDGSSQSREALASLRRTVAVVPQDTVLFNDTLRYNIAFGKPDCSQEELERAARTSHLDEFIRRQPLGWDTKVGERGVKLSGGERQRVSIARASLRQPRVYIFDEATSSLDSATETEIMRNLRELSVQTTTVVIAHRLSTVVHADQIIVLDDGEIAERGTHAELLGLHGKYAALWRAQQKDGPAEEMNGALRGDTAL